MNYFKRTILLCIFVIGMFFSCKGDKTTPDGKAVNETLIAGKTKVLVDNTVQPIVEDVLAVFHSVYSRSHVTQVNMTENEIINALLQDSASVVVLPRLLTAQEESHFEKLGIKPEVTPFATDAIAFITNKTAKDTVVNLEDVLKVLKGNTSDKVQKLVFDNGNSSTVQYLLKLAGVKQVPSQNVYSLKTNEEVIKYVHDTPGAIGIVGVNWLVQPPVSLMKYVDNITVLAVDNVKIDKGQKKYYKPTQSNIATGLYPLTRKLYVLNYRGGDGLGTGFAIYISSPEGQRIILKSGLLPVTIPSREIEVRKEL
ncbi:PstS family phosphate ABC transporter substrate-binding protein [Flavobacterium cerinum]|uniref:Phosphate ABC transporter substrate-binding protein n=1 Tax=Flavobacterium cerinum TaxID=2502784 RepID=A0A444GMR4_9FLAO|nr:substrate-binding domain-containing protein [Flavobacterium cerinum]RWW92248.1 phosphate ABC transporter substrate-binding protein [Flavobacterium cerinum]